MTFFSTFIVFSAGFASGYYTHKKIQEFKKLPIESQKKIIEESKVVLNEKIGNLKKIYHEYKDGNKRDD